MKSEEQWCCTRCHATTIDVPLDLRTNGPSWPCRTCRRETQRERYGAMARREQPMIDDREAEVLVARLEVARVVPVVPLAAC